MSSHKQLQRYNFYHTQQNPYKLLQKGPQKVGEGSKNDTWESFKGVKFTGTTINNVYTGKWCAGGDG
jgi:hypothetical protein